MNFDRMRALLLDQAIRGELVPQLVGEGVVAQIGTSLEEVPFEIPESWKWVPFSSIATLLNGRAYKKTELLEEPTSNGKDNTPILRVGNLFTSDKWYYSDLTLEDNKYCNPGDLLYAWSASFGPTIWQGCRSIYHYHIWRVDHNSSYVNKKWLYFGLLGKTQDLKRSGHGLAMIHITKKGMEQELVALPPLQEQVRIVAKLEEAFAEIDRAEKAYEELQTLAGVLRGQILQEAIEGKLVPQLAEEGVVEQIGAAPEEVPFEIPEKWKWYYLGSVIEYGKSNQVSGDEITSQTWVLDLEDIEKNTGRILEKKRGVPSTSNKNKFESGYVLYSKLRPYLNKVVVADEAGVCTTEIVPVNVNGASVPLDAKYLQTYLMSPFFVNYANQASYGVKMPRLGTKDARAALIPIPPLEEQKRIVQKVVELLSQTDSLAGC